MSGLSEAAVAEMQTTFDQAIKREIRRVREEERAFHMQTGAREAIERMHQACMLNSEGEELVSAWMKNGGQGHMESDGYQLYPVPF